MKRWIGGLSVLAAVAALVVAGRKRRQDGRQDDGGAWPFCEECKSCHHPANPSCFKRVPNGGELTIEFGPWQVKPVFERMPVAEGFGRQIHYWPIEGGEADHISYADRVRAGRDAILREIARRGAS